MVNAPLLYFSNLDIGKEKNSSWQPLYAVLFQICSDGFILGKQTYLN
jgi:hypothetical protein